MKPRSITARSAAASSLLTALLAGCATAPVGERVTLVTRCATASRRECRQPHWYWVRPCPFPVAYRRLPSTEAPIHLLTGGMQYDPGIRVRPYYRPWGIEPIGERIYTRRPFWNGWFYHAAMRNGGACATPGPSSLTSPSPWW